MSAFMVPVEHIRAMVNAGLQVQYGPMSWPTRTLTDEEQTLAYQQGEPWGPQASQVWTVVWRQLTPANVDAVGAMLAAQNRRSVDFRYAEEELEDVYTHGPSRTREPVEVLKAIDCYEYQSCETPDWEQTEAHSFCQTLRRQLIHQLPGYDQADTWPIEKP
jgi:hypothetical protein